MSITKLALESLHNAKQHGRNKLAKYAGALLFVLASHGATAQHTNDVNKEHDGIEHSIDTTHISDATHHEHNEEKQHIDPYGVMQAHYNYEEHHHFGGQAIFGIYGTTPVNSHTKLDYNAALWPLGADENPAQDPSNYNVKKIIYNAHIAFEHDKAGRFQFGKVGTIPHFIVKTFRPVAEEDRFMFDEVEVLHIAQGYLGASYSHPKVPGLTVRGGDISHKDKDLDPAGGISYHKDIGNAKLDAITYADDNNFTGILNRGEEYTPKDKARHKFASDLMFTFQTPWKSHHTEHKLIEHVDSTGNAVQKFVSEDIHHPYTFSGHVLASYYCAISPHVFSIIKLGGEGIATLEGHEVDREANGRLSGFITRNPKNTHGNAITFGGYAQVNNHGHIEGGGGITFTLGHGTKQY